MLIVGDFDYRLSKQTRLGKLKGVWGERPQLVEPLQERRRLYLRLIRIVRSGESARYVAQHQGNVGLIEVIVPRDDGIAFAFPLTLGPYRVESSGLEVGTFSRDTLRSEMLGDQITELLM